MHQCLLIQEILQVICAHINYPRRDMLAVALVCRDFFDASMDQLWYHVSNLIPVLQCLPSDIWRTPLTSRGIGSAVLARAITSTDLERFRTLYAHRVQVSQDTLARIPAEVYQALVFAFQGQPIFPNLVELGSNGLAGFPYYIYKKSPGRPWSPFVTTGHRST
ncbi:hypothetical protein BD779DRAFT_1528264 [Infundibulicybe gibba]|nr:hypothetical protein BD779DRAFT_1528264 [Infundibulicybe gibba]